MRKILFLLTLTSILGVTDTQAQYAFEDALKIRALLPAKPALTDSGAIILSDTNSYRLLQWYVSDTGTTTTTDIRNAFNGNPFITFAIEKFALRTRPLPGLALPTSIAGLDVTNIANGIAALMIERAKQELTIAFFNRFKKFTNDHPEFGVLFPVTTANLNKLLTYSYPQMLPVLRNGFFTDLKQLPANLPGILDLNKYQTLFADYPELRIAIRSLKFINEIQSGASSPADILDEFAALQDWTDGSQVCKNLGAAVHLAALFSHSLRSDDLGKVWISPSQLKPLMTDNTLLSIYLGLIWERTAKVEPVLFYHHGQTDSLASLIGGLKHKLDPTRDKLTQFVALAGQINIAYHTIQTNIINGKTNTNDDYYNYIGTAIDAIDSALKIAHLFYNDLDAEPYFTLIRTGNSLYKDIYSQQYTQTVSDVLDLFNQINTMTNAHTPATPNKAMVMEKASALSELTSFIEKVKPYAFLMANIVEAKSSDDVKAALDNAILPVGSSSIKKHTNLNVSIQSYLGAFAVTSHISQTGDGLWSDRFGVTAPIGISITPDFASLGGGGSFSLFLSAFDLGAIVDYQLKSDTTISNTGTSTPTVSKNYSIKLGQILSPGVYLVYGFFDNLPLAVGFGGQYGPGLSRINAGGLTVAGNPSWRACFFLTVDLPFFNIVNHPRSQ
jgi:hypothetical protein